MRRAPRHRSRRLVPDGMTFADHFSSVSAAYATFRPRYPDALFEYLAGAAPARDAAWDAGTGSGQAAVGLARHFTQVVATDASLEQIEHATANARVTYRVAAAEASGLEDRSVDLVTAAQAVHWFDRERFWLEVRRVLRPAGVIAIWTYTLFEIDPEIDAVVRRFYRGVLGPYWPPERRLTEERYQTIEFPFAEVSAPRFVIEQMVTLNDVAGYIRTWSATRAFIKQHTQDPVDRLLDDVMRAWRFPQQPRLARWPVSMRIGRI
jgi:SAM-dependent methyltransferase